MEFFVRVAKHLSELLFERVIFLKDLLSEVVLILLRLSLESVLQGWFELTERLSFEARGYEGNFSRFVGELLRVVLEVGAGLGEEPSERLLVASVLRRGVDLGLAAVSSTQGVD